MLILARYPQEALFIGEARIMVLRVARQRNGRMRITLGIDAPREIPIRRAELPGLHFQREPACPYACLCTHSENNEEAEA